MWALVTTGIALLTFSLQLMDVWSMGIVGIFAVLLSTLLIWVIRFFHIREPGSAGGMFSLPFAFPTQLKFFRHKSTEQDALSESESG